MQQLPCILSIDLGTSGPKVALVGIDGGIIAESTQTVKLLLQPDGGVEQAPDDWWQAVVCGIEATLAASGQNKDAIAGICCTAQWSGTVAVDRNGRALMNAIIWMDSRGAGHIHQLTRGLVNIEGYGVGKLAHWIYKTGGAPGQAGKDPLAHILYIKHQNPALYAATYKFLEPKDYLNFKLCGEMVSSYDTMALHWITNNRQLDRVTYDASLLALCQLDREKFPDLLPATAVAGTLRPELAARFGLSPHLPVIVGSPDVQTAAVGSGAVEDYAAHLYLGTSSWLTCHVPYKKTAVSTKMVTLPSALPGRYFIANAQESAGSCIEFLRQTLPDGLPASFMADPFAALPDDATLLSERDSSRDFAWLDAMAAKSPPGSRKLLFTPWLCGERTPVENHYLRAGFYNLALVHKREDLVRSVYEGVAYNSKWLLDSVEKFIKRPLPSLHVIGGGALSPIWCQIHADILQRKVRQVENPRQANARGAAWIAGLGLGLLCLDDIPKLVVIEREFEPDPQQAALYQEQFGNFIAIYHATKSLYKRFNHMPKPNTMHPN